MTHGELWSLVSDLPCVPAPPGFMWDSDAWQSGPTYIAWRRLFSKSVDPKDGQMLTCLCCLSVGDLEQPLLVRNETARIKQEIACASVVDLAVERGLNVVVS